MIIQLHDYMHTHHKIFPLIISPFTIMYRMGEQRVSPSTWDHISNNICFVLHDIAVSSSLG